MSAIAEQRFPSRCCHFSSIALGSTSGTWAPQGAWLLHSVRLMPWPPMFRAIKNTGSRVCPGAGGVGSTSQAERRELQSPGQSWRRELQGQGPGQRQQQQLQQHAHRQFWKRRAPHRGTHRHGKACGYITASSIGGSKWNVLSCRPQLLPQLSGVSPCVLVAPSRHNSDDNHKFRIPKSQISDPKTSVRIHASIRILKHTFGS